MNNLFTMHKSKKKLLLLAIIFSIIVVLIIVLFVFKKKNNNVVYVPSTFTATDSSVDITVPGEYEFTNIDNNSYILELQSSNSQNSIYISATNFDNIKDISKLIENDKNNFIANFSNINNVSEIQVSAIQDLPMYNYNFSYDENKYIDVYWIQKDSNFYVIDFNIDKNNNDFTPYIKGVLDSLKFN